MMVLDVVPNIGVGSKEFGDLGLVVVKVRVVYHIGIVAEAICEVRICVQLAMPLLARRSVLIVLADIFVHVTAHIGMVVEELATPDHSSILCSSLITLGLPW